MFCYNKCIPNFFTDRPTTGTIRPMGTEVAKQEDLVIGDIVYPSNSHVTIYIGLIDGIQRIIHAPQENDVVKISTVYAWVTARRLIPDDDTTGENGDDTGNTDPLPTTPEEQRECIVTKAKEQIGKAYGYGDEGPDKFDCSGLVMYVYNLCIPDFFIERPTTGTIKPMGTLIEKKTYLKIGDVVYPRYGHTSI